MTVDPAKIGIHLRGPKGIDSFVPQDELAISSEGHKNLATRKPQQSDLMKLTPEREVCSPSYPTGDEFEKAREARAKGTGGKRNHQLATMVVAAGVAIWGTSCSSAPKDPAARSSTRSGQGTLGWGKLDNVVLGGVVGYYPSMLYGPEGLRPQPEEKPAPQTHGTGHPSKPR